MSAYSFKPKSSRLLKLYALATASLLALDSKVKVTNISKAYFGHLANYQAEDISLEWADLLNDIKHHPDHFDAVIVSDGEVIAAIAGKPRGEKCLITGLVANPYASSPVALLAIPYLVVTFQAYSSELGLSTMIIENPDPDCDAMYRGMGFNKYGDCYFKDI